MKRQGISWAQCRVALAVPMVVLNLLPTVAEAGPNYSYKTIDPPGSSGNVVADSINASGQIAGHYEDSTGRLQGFLYSGNAYTSNASSYTVINPPGSAYVLESSLAINDKGQIVGSYGDSTGRIHGFLYSGGAYTTIDPPGSTDTHAYDINNAGQICGSSNKHGFLYSGGAYKNIDPPGSTQTYECGINNSGQIVGRYSNGSVYHGFLYSGSAYRNIDPPGSTQTFPATINDSGQIVGYYGFYTGFLYRNGGYTNIIPPGGIVSFAPDINASGQVVGGYSDGGAYHGYLYSGGSYTKIDPPGSIQTYASGLNASGQIVGYYLDSNGRRHGFLATRAFAGIPGYANCHGKSVSALATQYGGMNTAAWSLGYGMSGVQALQSAIRAYCGT